MRKEVMLLLSCIFLIMLVGFISAADSNLSVQDNAKKCLNDKLVIEPCSQLSTETKLFVFLAIGKCKNEIISDMVSNECLPDKPSTSQCRLKTTAQGALILDERGTSVTKLKSWLLNQTISPDNIDWFLEIETYGKQADCTITYDTGTDTVAVNADYTVAISSANCFEVDSTGYWFQIRESCLSKEFSISCTTQDGGGFLTNLLFKKSDSDTIHVAEKSQSSETGSPSVERVNSLCFAQGAVCDYEGSLWAAFAMKSLDESISPYMPYLITSAEDSSNSQFFPDAFLYRLTSQGNYLENVRIKQAPQTGYWTISLNPPNKYYDTALALYLDYSSSRQSIPLATTTSLKNDQDKSTGCWNNNNIRDTAFLLYSVFGGSGGSGGGCEGDECIIPEDCEDKGFFCADGIECEDAGGTIKTEFGGCRSGNKCCSINPLKSCDELSGEICDYGQICSGEKEYSVSDIMDYGQFCCSGGKCSDKEENPITEENACEKAGGGCYSSCEKDEKEDKTLSDACESDEVCCIAGTSEKSKAWIWILIIAILIILVILGIMYKDKLRPYYEKLKSSFKKPYKPSSGSSASHSPNHVSLLPERNQRSILPPSSRPSGMPSGQRPQPRPAVDDVLRKLREMGK